MRFAILMLSIVGIASVVGTLIKQNEPYNNYVVQLGQFWFPVFKSLDIYNVYQAYWFLIILIFLITSTSLCIYRNSPKIIKDLSRFQDKTTLSGLKRMKNFYEISSSHDLKKIQNILRKKGFTFKLKNNLLVAKKGNYQKLGYIFTHVSIVMIAIGGIIDGNMPLKVNEWLGKKEVEFRNLPFSEVPDKSQLEKNNFAYRANILLKEGESSSKGLIRKKNGYLVQHLPFKLTLEQFHIEHYSTGQPKSFLSDLIVLKENGEQVKKTISVNKPLNIDGISIYQSDFQDGGSLLKIKAHSLFNHYDPINLNAEILTTNKFSDGQDDYQIEFDDFREFNIFQIEKDEKLVSKNIGPSVIYKIRNSSGQATEYQTYQNPIEQDEKFYFMSGMRESLQEDFKYLKIPADEDLEISSYFQFVEKIQDNKNINSISVKLATDLKIKKESQEFKSFIKNTNEIFNLFLKKGYLGVSEYIEKFVPPEKQELIAESYIKIIHEIAFQKNLQLIQNKSINYEFIQDALNAYSDSFFYGPSPFFKIDSFKKIYSSGLQITKDPGKFWVYLGSLLLVIGIFCMIYIQEVRLWILKYNPKSYAIAFTSNRMHSDFDKLCESIIEDLKT
jgi:cytochrome c biogenesis protein